MSDNHERWTIEMPPIRWGHDIKLRVEEPSHGGWFCFNLRVTTGDHMTLYQDIRDDSTWRRRLWHRLAKPFRWLKRAE